MRKLVLMILLVLTCIGLIGATISNVHISPEYPNLDSSLIKVYADISNATRATLYYKVNDIIYSSYFSISKGFSSFIYDDIADSLKIFYWIEAINNENKETTQEFSFTYDATAPVISIIGENPTRIAVNSTYDELGATALDSVYGDLSSNVTISGSVDVNVLGEYVITYSVSDLAGNSATATRVVNVIEPATATVSITGGSIGTYSASSSGNEFANAIANGTGTNNPETASNEANSNTNTKAGITGKSIVELIGENKAIGIIAVILIIGAIIGYYIIKAKIKQKMWGK